VAGVDKGMKKHHECIKCLCHSHALEVEFSGNLLDDDTVYLNIWYDGRRGNTPLWERIQNAWYMLRRGYVIDGVLLNEEKTVKLRDALNKILDSE
jgi:hypothetical protein